MEQPPTPTASSAGEAAGGKERPKPRKRSLSPEEILAHYESQGLNSREAALQAVGDLQALLYSALPSSRGSKSDRLTADSLRKLDNANARLAILDAKLDSKPDIGQSFAIGLASGALLRGADAVLPHVIGGIRSIWNSVGAATKSSSSAP